MTQQVDPEDLTTIKTEPEDPSTRQPESSSTNMPLLTPSQTGAAHSSQAPNFLDVREKLENLDAGSDDFGPVRSSSSESYQAAEQGNEIHNTPKLGKITQSVCTERREAVLKADPNEGRCLITNRPLVVELCHLVANGTDDERLVYLNLP